MDENLPSDPPADLTRPPIWSHERPAPPDVPAPRVDPAVERSADGTTPPLSATPGSVTPPGGSRAAMPGSVTPPGGSRAAAPGSVTAPVVPGPTFEGPPQWPSSPPTSIPAPAVPPRRGRRALMTMLGLLALLAFAVGAFLLGRSIGASPATMESVAVSSPEATAAPTEAPAPTATAEPATPTPLPPTAVPAPVSPLPADDFEPVAAVAEAVAPAVVLISNDIGQGSGIAYDESGLILTNAHVVGSFTEVRVQLASGKVVPGTVVGADPLTDVAVVKIDPSEDFGIAVLAPEDSVQVGQLAVAIGSPFGLDQTVTSGVVSAIGRVVFNQTDGGETTIVAMIQTDAPINPGNSGGALADRQGRVIGMNTSIRTDGTVAANVGVGFAIPSDTMRLIADRIVAGEPLEQGFLGISGASPIVGDPGVVVQSVEVGSGAQLAGVEIGDRITSFNGIPIGDMGDLAAAVRLESPDASVPVEVVRNGESLVLEVTLGIRAGG